MNEFAPTGRLLLAGSAGVFGIAAFFGCASPDPVTDASHSKAMVRVESGAVTPPLAEKRSHAVPSPSGSREDEYYWLRDDTRKDPEVLAYLNAEVAYTNTILAPLRPLRETLFKEIVGRIKKDDESVPYFYHGYYYAERFEADQEYKVHYRRKGTLNNPEQVILDGNALALAAGHKYFAVRGLSVSPSGKLLAWAQDNKGRRQYTIRFKNIETDETLPDELPGTTSSIAWAADNQTLFYIEKDPVTLLSVRVKKHVLGTDPTTDVLVYEEKDHAYYLGVSLTSDDKYIVIHCSSTVSDEVLFIPANRPKQKFAVLAPRERNLEYKADHLGTRWIIRTNDQAKNFRIVTVADGRTGNKNRWVEFVPHQSGVLVDSFALFDDFLVLGERGGGDRRLRVIPWPGKAGNVFHVEFDDAAHTTRLTDNHNPHTEWLRFTYNSLTTPSTLYEVNLRTKERRLLKRTVVPGDFDSDDYASERVWAEARDGTKVPISLVYRKGFKRDGTAPLYQYAYGSYGSSSDPKFESRTLSLLDRGFVYAIAHIRGGQEMGREWYDAGKLLKKKNTFTDFIDVTEYLIREKYAARDKVVAVGGSAGGLLVGAVVNMRPDLYRVIAAHVPFVDVVTTMLDESIPLTTNEFDEWGNPRQEDYYRYMLSYSPYDNVEAKDYPAMLVTTGLWDSQVQYFEPAKWVARLRAKKTNDKQLIFHVNMEAGHGGKSGRFRRQQDRALEYAFVLDQLGMNR